MSVCLSVAYYAFCVDPDETLQGDPRALLKDIGGVGFGTFPVANVELLCCLCHRKYNNHAYTYIAGCMQKYLNTFQIIRICYALYICVYGQKSVYTYANRQTLVAL